MRKLLIISLIIGTVLQIYYSTVLPDKVAINFGSGGQVNSWTSRELSMGIMISIYLINALVFLSVPMSLNKTPLKYISFPKKGFWLAENRKDKSIPVIQPG